MLLVVPISFLRADSLDIDPIPLVIIEIVVSNIGGTATLIGDPPNFIIAGATDLSFTDVIVNAIGPCAELIRLNGDHGTGAARNSPGTGRPLRRLAAARRLDSQPRSGLVRHSLQSRLAAR